MDSIFQKDQDSRNIGVDRIRGCQTADGDIQKSLLCLRKDLELYTFDHKPTDVP